MRLMKGATSTHGGASMHTEAEAEEAKRLSTHTGSNRCHRCRPAYAFLRRINDFLGPLRYIAREEAHAGEPSSFHLGETPE